MPAEPCSRRCGHVATTTDRYFDGKPLCAHCFDRLDGERWAAEHGVPNPAPDPDLKPCTEFVS